MASEAFTADELRVAERYLTRRIEQLERYGGYDAYTGFSAHGLRNERKSVQSMLRGLQQAHAAAQHGAVDALEALRDYAAEQGVKAEEEK